jgi:Fe2+ transport system protein FeoA
MMPDVPRQLTADHAPLRRTWGARTLADLDAGELVEVHAVAPALRDVLADLGVREGDRVCCEGVRPYLIVRTPEGRVPLDHGLASAVHVSPPIIARDDARTA